MDDITRLFIVDLLPVVISVGIVGFKVYHDVKHLKITVVSGFKGITDEMHIMSDNISELQIEVAKNKTADEYNERELTRLGKDITRLYDKINNK